MNVLCPCGVKCKGVERFGAVPECYISYSGSSIDKATGIDKTLVDDEKMRAAWQETDDLLKDFDSFFSAFGFHTKYNVYKCPICGCSIVYKVTETPEGIETKKIQENSIC
jgi:hypothetical protein